MTININGYCSDYESGHVRKYIFCNSLNYTNSVAYHITYSQLTCILKEIFLNLMNVTTEYLQLISNVTGEPEYFFFRKNSKKCVLFITLIQYPTKCPKKHNKRKQN